MGDERNQTVEIIGYDHLKNHYTMNYYDNTGNSGTMIANITGDTWAFEGEGLRFTGGFSSDDQEFSGKWEQLAEGPTWIPFMNVTLKRKVNIPDPKEPV